MLLNQEKVPESLAWTAAVSFQRANLLLNHYIPTNFAGWCLRSSYF